jgi:hypothetical protein
MNYPSSLNSKSKTITMSTTSNASVINYSRSSNNSGFMERAGTSSLARERTKKEMEDFENLGIEKGTNAQLDISKANIAEKNTMGVAMEVMAVGLKQYQGKVEERDKQIAKQKLELEAYEKTLGRKLSEKEINEYIASHKPPALIAVDSDKAIMDTLDAILEQSHQITK